MKRLIFFLFLMLAATLQSLVAQPTVPAPTPQHAANRVVALFSNHYTAVGNMQYVPAVPQITIETLFADAPADEVMKISNLLNGSGNKEARFAFDTQDWRLMDTLHIDIFSPGNDTGIGEFECALISANGTEIYAGIWLNITTGNRHGEWIPIEVAVSKFATGNMQIDQVTHVVFRRGGAGSTGNVLYVDNIYAYQSEYIDHTQSVEAVSINGAGAVKRGATAQYGATVTGANYPPQTVTWTLTGAAKPATTLSSGGLLTVATDETAAVLTVIATSVYDNTKSGVYKIIVINPPATPAPEPTHAQEYVKSIFSDYYNNNGQFVVNYDDWLAAGTTKPRKEIITPFDVDPDDHLLFLDSLINSNVAQISLGAVSLTGRDSIHIDVYSPGGNNGIGEFEFSFYVGTNYWTNASWVQADVWYRITEQNRHDQWISLEVPVSKFVEKGEYALVLRLRRGAQGSPGQKLYVDNIYAYTSQYVDHTPVVNSVTVSGSTAVQRNTAAQYKATVSGANNPSSAVTWTLNGASSTATTLSTAGLLTVAADEMAATLSIIATSDYDPAKSGSLTVTLIDPPVMTVDAVVDLTAALPPVPAPAPRHDPDSVVCLFSDVYTYNPDKFVLSYSDWLAEGKTACTKEIVYPFENSPAESLLKLDLLYNDNQAQISLGTCNLAGMDSIHIDIYSPGDDQGIGEFD
ncbi:MAG: hypothetical protein LBF81_03260, partial [Prevotellaceae bacterium]|nr:hypothetical protein [Prevotellaceae bacterium]